MGLSSIQIKINLQITWSSLKSVGNDPTREIHKFIQYMGNKKTHVP